jgi:organic hydroperoxide reductase OsmC/OhrA
MKGKMMWTYKTSVNWSEGKTGVLRSENKPDVPVGTPPEFGGPKEGYWTPEDLVAAAVGSCIMTSALFFIHRAGIELQSYESNADAVMEKTPDGLTITTVTIEATVALKNPGQEDGLRKAVEQAEKNCPVSALLKCPVKLTIQVRT